MIMTHSSFFSAKKYFSRILVFVLFASFTGILLFPSLVQAVGATGFLRLDRMATSVVSSGTICMTPQGAGTVGKVVVTFPGTGSQSTTSFGVSSTAVNWTVTTTNLPTGASAWPGIGTATAVSGATVTFPSTSLITGTQYCFNFVSTTTLTNPTAAGTNFTGTIQTQLANATPVDTISYATSIMSNDQVAVTATVPSTFSFTLSSNTAALGSLSTSAMTAATAITATFTTNANNGWLAWVKSANAALNSASTGDSVPSAAFTTGAGNIVDLSAINGYVLNVIAGTGTPTIATEYSGGANTGGNFATTFKQIASHSIPSNADTVTLTVKARATATNKAATDYTDTLTVSAAGQF